MHFGYSLEVNYSLWYKIDNSVYSQRQFRQACKWDVRMYVHISYNFVTDILMEGNSKLLNAISNDYKHVGRSFVLVGDINLSLSFTDFL